MLTEKGTYKDARGDEWTPEQLRSFVEFLLDRMMEERAAGLMLWRLLGAANMLFVTDGKRMD